MVVTQAGGVFPEVPLKVSGVAPPDDASGVTPCRGCTSGGTVIDYLRTSPMSRSPERVQVL